MRSGIFGDILQRFGGQENIVINEKNILENCCTGNECMSHMIVKHFLQNTC